MIVRERERERELGQKLENIDLITKWSFSLLCENELFAQKKGFPLSRSRCASRSEATSSEWRAEG